MGKLILVISGRNPVKSNFRFWLSRNQSNDMIFQFRIDHNKSVKKYIPVPVTKTGIVFSQIQFPVPVLKIPSGCTLIRTVEYRGSSGYLGRHDMDLPV